MRVQVVTTDTGFEGRGEHTIVDNGRNSTFTLNDMLVHPSGDRIRAHLVLIIDLETSKLLNL